MKLGTLIVFILLPNNLTILITTITIIIRILTVPRMKNLTAILIYLQELS